MPEEDLRLLFVHDARVREDHAVVTVHLEGRWLVLDNRWLALAEDTELRRFAPLFSIGSEGLGHWPQPPNEEHRRNGGRMPVRQFFLC